MEAVYTVSQCISESSKVELERLAAAYLRIWNAAENLPFLSLTGLPFSEDQVRTWFSNRLAQGIRYDTATDADGAIAAIMITQRNSIAGFRLAGLAVSPEHKYRGIGKMMVSECLKEAESEGYRAVDTQVFATNASMLRLVIGFGFVPIKIEYHRGPEGADLIDLKRYCPI